ncbi:uncharacterized protein G2W53_013131 [Senna tora]|uniref:Uncharacterized protein n=1 Tax=Senna tora TaxID=362788 RepID=A0A834TYC6_9FABA|nr:uncharacterized protein G2W53_013131 [Senna tora]
MITFINRDVFILSLGSLPDNGSLVNIAVTACTLINCRGDMSCVEPSSDLALMKDWTVYKTLEEEVQNHRLLADHCTLYLLQELGEKACAGRGMIHHALVGKIHACDPLQCSQLPSQALCKSSARDSKHAHLHLNDYQEHCFQQWLQPSVVQHSHLGGHLHRISHAFKPSGTAATAQ